LFSSAESRATFEADPAKYEIQLGGLCARMGGAVLGNPADFLVHDGKIYIFGSDACHKNFAAAPARYLPSAPAPISRAPADVNAGRALFDRAVAAVGGRVRLEGITTYVETATQVLKRAMGDAHVTQTTMWRSNGDMRQERAMKIPDRSFSMATLLTPSGAWFLSSMGPPRSMIDAASSHVRMELQRHLIALLRAGSDDGATIAATGSATVQGSPVEQARIVKGALDVTLGIDPASGEPRTLAFVDRNGDGEFGRYVLMFSEFRTTSGLRLPFKVQAQFNGEPEGSRSWTVESIKVNEPLDDSLFRPAGGR
jgi:YHS domain-containing protein